MSAKITITGDASSARQAVEGLGDSFADFRQSARIMAEEIKGSMTKSKVPVKNFKLELAAITTVAGQVVRAVRAIGDAAMGPLKAAAAAEDAEIAFTQFMGSATDAQKMLKEINDFSVKTPFEPAELRSATQMLLGAGIAAEDVFNIIKETAAVSKNGQQLGELGDALAKGFAKGKFQTEEVNKFLERGINLMPEFEKVTGKTGDALTKAIQKGLRFDDVRAAIGNLSKEGGQFFGLLEKRSQSSTGLISTITGAFTQFQEQLAAPILLDLAPVLADIISQLGDAIAIAPELGAQIAAGVSMAVDAATGLASVLGDIATGSGALGQSVQLVAAAFLAVKLQAGLAAASATAGLIATKFAALGTAAAIRTAAASAAALAAPFLVVVAIMKTIQLRAEGAAASIRMIAGAAKSAEEALQRTRDLRAEIAAIKTTEERDAQAKKMDERIAELKSQKAELQKEFQDFALPNTFGAQLKDFVTGPSSEERGRDIEVHGQLIAINRELDEQKKRRKELNESTAAAIAETEAAVVAENLTKTTAKLKELKKAFDDMMAKAKEAGEKRTQAGDTNDRTLAMLRAEIAGNDKKLAQLKEEKRILELTAQLKSAGFNETDASRRAREQVALEQQLADKKSGKEVADSTSTIVASSLASVGGGRGGFATNSPLLGVNQRQLTEQQATRRAVEKLANREPSTINPVAVYA